MVDKWLLFMLAAFAMGAAFSIFAGRRPQIIRRLSHDALLTGAVAGTILAFSRLRNGGCPFSLSLPTLFPFAKLSLALDGLSAFFLLVVSLIAIAAAIYGPAYLKSHSTSSPIVETLGINLFVGCMVLVLLAGDCIMFLLAWEGMTLASYALVVSSGTRANTRAGLIYIIMAHAGTALLMIVFLMLS